MHARAKVRRGGPVWWALKEYTVDAATGTRGGPR